MLGGRVGAKRGRRQAGRRSGAAAHQPPGGRLSGKVACLLVLVAGALVLAAAAQASETTSYAYDALGRLVRVTTSGGAQSGPNVLTCYDRAGNRTRYAVAIGTPPPPCPPPPPPPARPQGGAAADPAVQGGADV